MTACKLNTPCLLYAGGYLAVDDLYNAHRYLGPRRVEALPDRLQRAYQQVRCIITSAA